MDEGCAESVSLADAGSVGISAFFLLVLGFLCLTATDGATVAPALRLSSSVDKVEGLICPRVALAAIWPSLVLGMYAPPANL